ncbi:MAG: reverse transcriptase domain-containing protein, partial [Rhabdochlamydiaceae bacterium]
HSGLFEQIIAKENLFAAWREFQVGKMRKTDVAAFAEKFEYHLVDLYHDLEGSSYRHGAYTRFTIQDPKFRKIAKASVRDRVLHHAICRILMPIYDKKFIFDSYSSRKEKGTHRATERFQRFAWRLSRNNTRPVWILKCDIRKFFESVDHNILLDLCRTTVDDERVLSLLANIIRSFSAQSGCGIPLGNLTSQLFANVYLNELDQYVKRELRCKNYIRYTDDFVLLSSSRAELENMLPRIRTFLQEELHLELHPHKVEFRRWHQGVDFLGYNLFPHFQIVRTKTKRRIMRKLQQRLGDAREGKIEMENFNQIKQSYLGVLSHGRSKGLRRSIFK